MTLPTTDSNKSFAENKTVEVGAPTEAEADHNVLAANTDWLKEAKIYGWRGSCDDNGDRISQKNSTGSIWVGKYTGTASNGDGQPKYATPVTLCDVSAVGIPPESDGLKYRLLALTFTVAWGSSGFLANYDIEDFLPTLLANNEQSRHLGSDNSDAINSNGATTKGTDWDVHNSLICSEPLWAGDGQSAWNSDLYLRKFTWGSYTLYFWIDSSSGDLKFTFEGPTNSRMVVHGVVFYGPQWTEA